ncbi:hypothetical protein JCM8547_003474 [Rhodosporidiobolus lusitaniae]
MLKWLKSKSTSPNSSSSSSSKPSPAPPSTDSRPPRASPALAPAPADALHGLGLSVPSEHPLAQLDGVQGGGKGGAGEAAGGGRAKSPRLSAVTVKDEEDGIRRAGSRNASRRNSTAPPAVAGGEDGGASGSGRRGGSPALVALGAERTTSPLSFSPSAGSSAGGFQSPYGGSTGAFSERDPQQIYAPTTWSEMAHQELVVNVSSRERTRQEILWEVVASEERYVAELRSLVDLYANPLLHPLLSSSPPQGGVSPFLGSSSPPLLSASSPPMLSSPFPASSTNPSSSELPIAARFSRSTGSLSSNSGNNTPNRLLPGGQNLADLPEISDSDSPPSASAQPQKTAFRGRASLPNLPTGARQNPSTASLNSLHAQDFAAQNPSSGTGGGRLASFGFRSARHPLRPAPSSAKLQKSAAKAPPEVLKPPPLPEALKQALEATVDMLKGHEELSLRLKERWAKDFPLVRGLAAIWSDQPWFLQTYALYIVSLEEALSTLDSLLPSFHSPALASYAAKFKSPKSGANKDDKKLAKALMTLEERAADAGEGSLSICLSKPLMRLSKLPLLMQALLYHTDPTTHEWEKTRAMALEVDALVRSIEDEKIEEEERERTRDIFARIDGINDKALMAPRSSRIVIEEIPVPDQVPAPRGKSGRKSLSSSTGSGRSTADDWLIRFTDVVIRAQKIGETSIPGSFSRDKEKKGKQGKTRKTGKLRNTYRFIRIERWELREAADAALVDMNDLRRAVTEESGRPSRQSTDSEEEDDAVDAESRMSFRYDSDEPQPSDRRTFSSLRPRKPALRSSPLAPTTAKFGTRLRVGSEDAAGMRLTSPNSGHTARFASPTLSSKQHAVQPTQRRAASTPVGPASPPPPPRTVPPPAVPVPLGIAHARDESTFGLYEIWASQDKATSSRP